MNGARRTAAVADRSSHASTSGGLAVMATFVRQPGPVAGLRSSWSAMLSAHDGLIHDDDWRVGVA